MGQKSWHLDRRTLLRGVGASLALPWLESMSLGSDASESPQPKRLAGFYFGFGVGMPKKDSPDAEWGWFPKGEGRDFEFTEVLSPLQPLRDHVTVIGGLSHPEGRRMGGHDTGDTFLTGAFLNNKMLENTVSVDQVAAAALSNQTRFSSLVLSTDGGVGEPTRSSTLSYDLKGRPVPSLNQPQQVFDRFFGVGDSDSLEQRRQLRSASAMLDRVLDDSKSLRNRLGSSDQRKLDEYLASIRQIEESVGRSQKWLEIPRPELSDQDREMLRLDADDQAPKDFIRTMYTLIYLALRTDSTRVATYQVTNMADCSSKAAKFPQLEGFKKSLHSLAHDWNKPGGLENLGRWDQFMAQQYADFLSKLASAEESEGSVLDNSVIIYGSSNSTTHNNTNYPIVLAGGNNLGLFHGQYLKLDQRTPMSNLLLTMLHAVGVEDHSFADSTDQLWDVMRS